MRTLGWKLVVDAADAPRLGDLWAAALGYELEDHSPLLERLLSSGQIGEDAVFEHHGRRAWRAYAAVRHPDDPVDEATGVGRGRRILFQHVPEPKPAAKNRLHIDIHSEPGGLDALVTRLEGLGATRVREVDQGPAGRWWVMTDPEGNEFCAA
ncbi:VOC family protein [Streptomyces sp. 7-21]|uniref:VOC family protein n=1 Tax=Streptomyces sp. 7-21 TaxID=2802283 RepID=UPI00191FA2CC|nr:VOC family protein [Streptomyces sp. 7-21]MBL1065506.1 glyoxalase/bleomycin resistance/dioxygenase family protein [Streptomyces sp. 7-21]